MATLTAKKKILVIDDSPIMTLVLGNIVAADPQLQVVEYASDGLDGLKKVETAKPDLIILDLEMPKMNGVEFMKQVRFKSQAKVIVVTAEAANSEKVQQIKTLGIDGLVFKPSNVVAQELKNQKSQEIRNLIHQVLKI
ncbi:MAG: response regulator [Synechocystis sp.]|nr:response regulator [Synechocystis sp.]